MEKKILQNRLSPGDILIMSGVIRDLLKAYPGEYKIDVRSPSPEVYENNPNLTPLRAGDTDVETIDMQYPLIHHSGYSGLHFSDGHRLYLQEKLKRKIPKTSMRPDIFLSQSELNWIGQLRTEFEFEGKYWIINAGIKDDYTLKQYPYFQEVVDILKDEITFVQVGHQVHSHKPLNGVLDLVGKTSLRQLFRLSYYAEGAVCAVSLQMVIMQAFKKPCVIVAGGREGMRWQAINDHRFLHTNGLLTCCLEDGCWKSKLADCVNKKNNVPKCMDMIKPEVVAQAIRDYYIGGRLQK